METKIQTEDVQRPNGSTDPQMRSARQEYFEYTPGVLRAFVRPAHLDSLTFTLQLGECLHGFRADLSSSDSSDVSVSGPFSEPRQPVFERKMGVKFIWGEARDPGISDDFRTKDLSMSGKKRVAGPFLLQFLREIWLWFNIINYQNWMV